MTLVLAALLLSAPSAQADKVPPPVAKKPDAAKEPPPVQESKKPPPVRETKASQADSSSKKRQLAGIETAVLVLDASASMADPIDGKNQKMSATKQAVATLLASWDQEVPLGLTAYGHGDGTCSDIESVVPVEKLDRAKFQAAVNALQPSGTTPLTEAIISAAEELDYTENQATLIVVSDGAETCGADPCEMASTLEKLGVDLTVHVIGFGVSEEQSASLACIASNTGGTYKGVRDAAQLSEALKHAAGDVQTRKKGWRKRSGHRWGKNGRWRAGRWSKGKFDGRKKQHWVELRKRWEKKYGKPGPGNKQWSADGRKARRAATKNRREVERSQRPSSRPSGSSSAKH